ncbi:MAG: peptidylprolyl isomerase [Bacteroidota bacterium]
MKRILFLLAIAFTLITCDQDDSTYAIISTDYGDMKVRLFNSTPQHRDNFIKVAESGLYDGTLFHRVIEGFMIQGGDPDSKAAAPGVSYGRGGPGYLVPAELGNLHFKGALAAARTGNPEKKSSGSQFYVVHGKIPSDQELAAKSQRNLNSGGRAYTDAEVQLYKEIGGTPGLDFDYTVFGEVVEGMEVLDAIAAMPVNSALGNRPLTDVKMTVKILD